MRTSLLSGCLRILRAAPALAVLVPLAAAPARADVPVTLRGSPGSMARQHAVARDAGLTFAETPAQIRALTEAGALVRLEGNADYGLHPGVAMPVARPEMRTFVERLAAGYRAATGEQLIVTSLTRPATRQPGNAHALSVHPTGIALDLRVSQRPESRKWLEEALLEMERQGLLDVTRERRPPHYHVALFPGPYLAHEARLAAREAADGGEAQPAAVGAEAPPASPGGRRVSWPLLAAAAAALAAAVVLRFRAGPAPG
jgi:hypothetical protein